MNTLVVVGDLGNKTAYLNVPEAEAVARWFLANPLANEVYVDVFLFVHDAWAFEPQAARGYKAKKPI